MINIDDIDIYSIYWLDFWGRGHTTYWRDINGKDLDETTGKVIFWEGTTRDLLNEVGYATLDEVDEDDDWIVDIANKFGLDTTIYRADYLLHEWGYTASPLSEKEAILSWLIHDGGKIKTVTDTASNDFACSGNFELTPITDEE